MRALLREDRLFRLYLAMGGMPSAWRHCDPRLEGWSVRAWRLSTGSVYGLMRYMPEQMAAFVAVSLLFVAPVWVARRGLGKAYGWVTPRMRAG